MVKRLQVRQFDGRWPRRRTLTSEKAKNNQKESVLICHAISNHAPWSEESSAHRHERALSRQVRRNLGAWQWDRSLRVATGTGWSSFVTVTTAPSPLQWSCKGAVSLPGPGVIHHGTAASRRQRSA
jgi:hypothetical protein